MADSLEVGDLVEYLGEPWTVTETYGQDEYPLTTLECMISDRYHVAILNPQAVERLVRLMKKYSPQ